MKNTLTAIVLIIAVVALFFYWDKASKKKQQELIDANKEKADQLEKEIKQNKPVSIPSTASAQDQLLIKASDMISRSGALRSELEKAIESYKAAVAAKEFNAVKQAMIDLQSIIKRIEANLDRSTIETQKGSNNK